VAYLSLAVTVAKAIGTRPLRDECHPVSRGRKSVSAEAPGVCCPFPNHGAILHKPYKETGRRRLSFEVGVVPTFVLSGVLVSSIKEQLIIAVEASLALSHPEVELVDLELRGGRNAVLTLFVDRQAGVDVELCAEISAALDDLRADYALEVSSPGLDRPLRKPSHFAAALGKTIAVKTIAPIDGRSNYRGTLSAADGQGITVTLEDGVVARLAYDAISRAHVVFSFKKNGGQHE
jgi:ribosome maturation factor RimP